MKTNTCMQTSLSGNVVPMRKERLNVIPGIWIGGKTYWMNSGFEKHIPEEGISVQLKQEHIHSNIRLINVFITNHEPRSLSVKLLFQHKHVQAANEHISFISPSENVIFHLADGLIYLVNSHSIDRIKGSCSVQPYMNIHSNNIWACSESGTLKYNPMAKGNAVSLFLLEFQFQGKDTIEGKSWIISSDNEDELLNLNEALLKTY
ncbi:hypothetical protein BGM26_10370 [Bacillus sp. FJAT-29790]|uniref:hypothetical protein n=1 Tax=Bacillus sp. FJAT-29790 TaxID=1895002 RepID=UPI001C23A635|nr:hypothetical protein [Bacillus sp. FJAT-29790]MBU8879388.1 hypothetical protein [Bacillus sp. FJAT-29790]